MSDIAIEVTMNSKDCEVVLDREQYDIEVKLPERNVEVTLES